MAKKKKSADRSRQRRAQARRERSKSKKKQRAGADASPAPGEVRPPRSPSLAVPLPERCLPPVYVDASGSVQPSPWGLLGLAEGERDEATVREAWRRALIAHPPEREPEVARLIGLAREWILDPEGGTQRVMGTLHVPDPAAWGLESAQGERPLDPEVRLLGQAALYALVEDVLWEEGLEALVSKR